MYGYQIISYGLLFMVVGTIFDSGYAIIFSKFRDLIANKYLKTLNQIGGIILVLVGFWMFFY